MTKAEILLQLITSPNQAVSKQNFQSLQCSLSTTPLQLNESEVQQKAIRNHFAQYNAMYAEVIGLLVILIDTKKPQQLSSKESRRNGTNIFFC
jgi:hypothetical protein